MTKYKHVELTDSDEGLVFAKVDAKGIIQSIYTEQGNVYDEWVIDAENTFVVFTVGEKLPPKEDA